MPRRQLAWETWLVEIVFLFPAIAAAVGALAAHVGGDSQLSRIPTIVPGHPVENLAFDVLHFAGMGMVVPLALFLLARTGQPPAHWPPKPAGQPAPGAEPGLSRA